MKDLMILAGLAAALLLIFAIGFIGLNTYECNSRAGVMKMRSQYGVFTGCMIEAKAGWIGIDQYRVIE